MPVLFLNTTLPNSTGKPGLLYCTNDVIIIIIAYTIYAHYMYTLKDQIG